MVVKPNTSKEYCYLYINWHSYSFSPFYGKNIPRLLGKTTKRLLATNLACALYTTWDSNYFRWRNISICWHLFHLHGYFAPIPTSLRNLKRCHIGFLVSGVGLYTKTEEMIAGIPLSGSLRNYSFEGNSKNAILIYLPGDNQCLKTMTPNDMYDPNIPDILRDLIPISNLDRIEEKIRSRMEPPGINFW